MIFDVNKGWVRKITYVSFADVSKVTDRTDLYDWIDEPPYGDSMTAYIPDVSADIFSVIQFADMTNIYIAKYDDEWESENGDPLTDMTAMGKLLKRHFLPRFVPWLVDKAKEIEMKATILNKTATQLLADVESTIIEGTKTADSEAPDTSTFASAPISDVLSRLQQYERTLTSKDPQGTLMMRINEVRDSYRWLVKEVYDDLIEQFGIEGGNDDEIY